MTQILVRFLAGGIVVSAFALVGDLLKPKSFAGLFGAAPSVALATLALTVAHDGSSYAAAEARSMVAGALAFFVYASCVSWVLMRYKPKALWITVGFIPLWLGVSLGLWRVWLR
jgi:hydrogenase-4 membrane subunit HyfE